MAITVNKSPDSVSLSKNFIEYELQTDNYVINAGQVSIYSIQITGSPAVDDQFTLKWVESPPGTWGKSVTFTCKAAPDDSGTQFIDNAGALPLEEWADLLRDYMEKNYTLSQYFALERYTDLGNEFIRLTAIEKGLDGEITLTESIGWMNGVMNQGGVDTEFQSNMKVVLQVFVEKTYQSGNFTKEYEEEHPPDSSSKAIFDIREILAAFLNTDLPSFNQNTISQCTNIIKKFYTRYYERYGDTITEQEIITAATLNVMMGGTGFKFFSENPDFWTDHLTPQKAFLTWQPDDKNVTEQQHEYLYFPITGAGTTTIKSKADIYYTDGSSDLDVLIESKAGISQFEIYIIPVGYNQVISGIKDAGKTVDYYVIKITKQTGIVISELRTYYLYTKKYLETNYLLYKNSLGTYETLRYTGEIVKGLNVTKKVFQTLLPSDYNINDSEFSEINASGRENEKFSTGYVTKAAMQHLQEFLLSDSRFLVSDTAYLAITLKTKKIKFYKTRDDLYAMSFEIEPAYQANSYSND